MSSKLHRLTSVHANRANIVREFRNRTGLSDDDAQALLGHAFDAIAEFVSDGGTVHIAEIGSFLAVKGAGRSGIIVQYVPSNRLLAKCLQAFPGWALAEKIRREEAEAERARRNRMLDIQEDAKMQAAPPPTLPEGGCESTSGTDRTSRECSPDPSASLPARAKEPRGGGQRASHTGHRSSGWLLGSTSVPRSPPASDRTPGSGGSV